MYLLAVSGGPDSMFLLNKYKNKKVVVAHVNYNKRSDSHIDQEIVERFCKEYNIPYKVLDLHEDKVGNFQHWARIKRYEFFKELYDEYNCTKLLIAHHKDDFLETALMQQRSGRTPRYFGIKEKSEFMGMKIERPFVNLYFKDEILKKVETKGIPYAVDSSNSEPVYERNKIRLEFKDKSRREKQNHYSWFVMSNKILKKKFRRVDKKVFKILENGSSLKDFRKLSLDTKEVVYEILHQKFGNINLSSKKIASIIDFINGPEGNKKFLINKDSYLFKNKGKLEYIR